MTAPVLDIRNLRVEFPTRAGLVRAVNDVSLSARRGEILGLVGESGSGKTVTGFATMGLIDAPGRIAAGDIRIGGESVVGKSEDDWRKLRGRKIAMIFQDPMMTLNPVLRIDTQMIEAITAHESVSKETARQRARDALGAVGIASPDERLKAYPHEFSGGMRQRVAIAIALLNNPEIIIADEPTTALDVTIQAQILALVQKLAAERGMALVWITHDLGVVSGLADRIAVMYAGRIVEEGATGDVLDAPRHPYTLGLLRSLPSENKRGEPIRQIPGSTPSLATLSEACAFAPRCFNASERCRAAFPPPTLEGERRYLCFHPVKEEMRA